MGKTGYFDNSLPNAHKEIIRVPQNSNMSGFAENGEPGITKPAARNEQLPTVGVNVQMRSTGRRLRASRGGLKLTSARVNITPPVSVPVLAS